MKSITFEGRLSGDCECFCWADVPLKDRQEIHHAIKDDIIKNMPQEDKQYQEWLNQLKQNSAEDVDKNIIYPNDIFNALGLFDKTEKYKFTIIVEEI